MKKIKFKSKKIATLLVCGAILGNSVIIANPIFAEAQAGETAGEVSFLAKDWPTWNNAIKDTRFGSFDSSKYQVQHDNKIWEASWWMDKNTVKEPGSEDQYNTGWKQVGFVVDDYVFLSEGVSKNPFPMTNGNNGDESDNFNVGQGIQWPEQVFSPFVDMTAYVSDAEFAITGAPNLKELAIQSGAKYFNLGFIQAFNVDEDRINWSWGGFAGLNEKDNDGWQYEGIKKSIKDLRGIGGDISVSFGGLNTGAIWEVTSDNTMLVNAYNEIIQGYGLTRIDFDVEGGIQGYNNNLANAKAVKEVQDATGVEVTLTLPVMDFGLTLDGLGTLQAYLDAGVDLSIVNIMTMCYGPSVSDYAQGSIDAVENTKNQVQEYYKLYASKELSDSEAFKKIGTTTSIGFENEAHPYFSGEMMKKVVDHASEKNIGQVSFWSINRDAKIDNGQGKVENKFEYSAISKVFTDKPEVINSKAEVFVEYNDNAAYVGVELPSEEFESDSNRYVIFVNDEYIGECYNNKAYYSTISKKDDKVKFYNTVDTLKKGDRIEVYTVRGLPGVSTAKKNRIDLIDSVVAEKGAAEFDKELLNSISNIEITNKKVTLSIDKIAQEGSNRFVVKKNGDYIAESHAGKVYYAGLEKKELVNELSVTTDISLGDQITVELVSGKPGLSYKNILGNVFEVLVNEDMIK